MRASQWPLLSGLLLAGCAAPVLNTSTESALSLLNEKAPLIGSQETPTIENFSVGQWRTMSGMDPDQAKQMGMQSIAELQEGQETYTIKADGTFTVTSHRKNSVLAGTYQISGDTLTMIYNTVDGKPLPGSPDWVIKDTVKLIQWKVAPNKQMFYCNAPIQDPTGGNGVPQNLAAGVFLSRLETKLK